MLGFSVNLLESANLANTLVACLQGYCIGFEVLAAESMKSTRTISWVVKP
jgi:hypothetical protein